MENSHLTPDMKQTKELAYRLIQTLDGISIQTAKNALGWAVTLLDETQRVNGKSDLLKDAKAGLS